MAERDGEKLLAWRRWKELEVQFAKRSEGSEANKSATRLEQDPGLKRERELESRYRRVHDETAGLRGLPGYSAQLVKLKGTTLEPGMEARFARQALASEAGIYWKSGLQAMEAKSWKRAAELFETLLRLEESAAGPCFFAACARAQLGETGRAMDLLSMAKSRGFKNVDALKENPLLKSLQGNPEFIKLIQTLEAKPPRE